MKYKFEKYLTGDQVEKLSIEIDNGNSDELILQVSDFEDARLFANSRLMSLLLKCRQRNIKIIIDTAQHTSDFFSKIRNKKFFLNTVTGFIVVAFADLVTDELGVDFTELVFQMQLDELAKTITVIEEEGEIFRTTKGKGTIESGKEKTAFFFDGFNKSQKADIFQNAEFPDKVKEFNSDFSFILNKIGLNIRRNYSKIELISSNIGFEAVQNINDHALKNLKGEAINQLQFVHFHRININNYKSTFDYIIEEEKTPITEYLNAIREKYQLNSESRLEAHLYEISISDSGVGIPARLAGTMDVYKNKIDIEKQFLFKALHESISSKLRKTEDIGYGLPKIMQAVKMCDGLIVFRTGRLQMFRHFLENKNTPLNHLSNWDSNTLSFLPGTSISILFPIVSTIAAKQIKIF